MSISSRGRWAMLFVPCLVLSSSGVALADMPGPDPACDKKGEGDTCKLTTGASGVCQKDSIVGLQCVKDSGKSGCSVGSSEGDTSSALCLGAFGLFVAAAHRAARKKPKTD